MLDFEVQIWISKVENRRRRANFGREPLPRDATSSSRRAAWAHIGVHEPDTIQAASRDSSRTAPPACDIVAAPDVS
jgi:hypothetical protein